MAEIEITLPTVQFGNVKLRATPEELGIPDISNADQLGIVTAIYLNLFTQGFKTGAQMDVSAPVAPVTDDDIEAAVEAIKGGLGATELPSDEAEDARTGGEYNDAPWTETVASKPKPWEAEVAPAVLDAAW